MARDNFISDNLINIREQLRQDQGQHNPVDSAAVNLSTVSTAETQKELPSELPVPAPRMQLRTPELDRERRELIGRIRRDYTLAAAELEQMDFVKKEALYFMDFLSEQQKKLESLDLEKSNISKDLDRYAWEYYQRSGRWRAFSSGTPQKENIEQPQYAVRNGSKLTAAAIIVSALIISGSILIVFL